MQWLVIFHVKHAVLVKKQGILNHSFVMLHYNTENINVGMNLCVFKIGIIFNLQHTHPDSLGSGNLGFLGRWRSSKVLVHW